MRRTGYETIRTFEKALDAEPKRKSSKRFKENNPQYLYNFLYVESGKYGEQIQRYFNYFEKSQFLFLKYDDLKNNPNKVLNDICKFLNVEEFQFTEKIYSNKGHQVKSIFIEKIIHSRIKNNWLARKIGLKLILEKYNRNLPKGMKNDTRNYLNEMYKKDAKLLFELTGIKF